MSMGLETYQDYNTDLYQNTPIIYWGNIRVGGFYPHQITLVSPLSAITELDQNGLWLTFTWVLPRGHDKVLPRSQQGQIS